MPKYTQGQQIEGGTVNFDPNTGQRLSAGQSVTYNDPSLGIPTRGNVITPDSLQPPPTINMPFPKQKTLKVISYQDNPDGTTTNFLSDGTRSTVKYTRNPDGSLTPSEVPQTSNAAADAIFNASQVEDSKIQNQATGLSTSIADAIGKLTGQTQELYNQQQAAGLPQLKQDLQTYNSQILKKQAEIAQSDVQLIANMRAEERRDTLLPFAQDSQSKLAGDAAIMRALKSSEIGVLNAQVLAKQGDIALAKETAQQAVDLKYAPYKELIELGKAQLEAIQPLLTKAEKKQADQQTLRANMAMKEIDKISDFQKTALANAISNNAPQSVLNKINSARSIDDILNVGSGYIMSIDDKIKQGKLSGAGVTLSPKILATTQFKNAQAANNLRNTLKKAIDAVDKYGNYERANAEGKGILDSLKIQLRSEISTALDQGVVQPGEAASFDSIAGQLNKNIFVRNKKTLGSLNSLYDSMSQRINNQKSALQSGYGVLPEQIDAALGVLTEDDNSELFTIDADGNIVVGGGEMSNEQFFN